MLDVHPPHAATHTWKDFFIHIATIVVGLFIALGLEQLVEKIHEHRQVAEARENLREAREKNRLFYSVNVAELEYGAGAVENNLIVLRFLKAHPGAPEATIPGVLRFNLGHEPPVDSAWNTVEQNRITSLMPASETEDDSNFYRLLAHQEDAAEDVLQAITRAREYATLDPDLSHLSPSQIDIEIERVQDLAIAEARWGLWLNTFHSFYPAFGPPPSKAALAFLSGYTRTPDDQKSLAAAISLTDNRLAAAAAARKAATKAAGEN